MINGTNLIGKDNPRWPIGNATETIKVPEGGPPFPRGPARPRTATGNRTTVTVAEALRTALVFVRAWLANLPHRVGSRLFARNDEEARWRGWQVTELSGGLARRYRDPRFDTLRDQLDPNGGRVGLEPDQGTQQGRRVQAVPEAWDDHWDGNPLNGQV